MRRWQGFRWSARGAAPFAPVVLLTVFGCAGQAAESEALRRGDEAWARGDTEEAVAEYRLALRASDDPETVLRVAHAYASLGRIDEARDYYRQVVTAESRFRDQAVADLVLLARRADERGDRYGLAGALELALELEPGIGVGQLALPLARYYSDNGEFERALPFYQRAVVDMEPDAAAGVYYDVGLAYEELGECDRALSFFEQARPGASRTRRSEIDWHLGNCSFLMGLELRRSGRDDEALRHLDLTARLGEPRNLLPQVHFERGEVLAARGECTAAVEAFRQVIVASGPGGGPLVPRAEQRIDEIRFGRPSGAPAGGRC